MHGVYNIINRQYFIRFVSFKPISITNYILLFFALRSILFYYLIFFLVNFTRLEILSGHNVRMLKMYTTFQRLDFI